MCHNETTVPLGKGWDGACGQVTQVPRCPRARDEATAAVQPGVRRSLGTETGEAGADFWRKCHGAIYKDFEAFVDVPGPCFFWHFWLCHV